MTHSSAAAPAASSSPITGVKALRMAVGLSRAQLSRDAGCSVTLLYNCERGYVPRRPEIRRAIADALGVHVTACWPAEDR